MSTEYGEAAKIIETMRGSLVCDMVCPNRQQDEVAADIARRNGDQALADRIMEETAERESRCLGGVACNGQVGCGVENGNLKIIEGIF